MCLYTQENFYTQKLFCTDSFYTEKLLHTEAFADRSFCKEKLLHRDTCTHRMAAESTKHFPVQLRTTKLAQSTSQYNFVLQSLHKVLPSTTLYYKACIKFKALPSTISYTEKLLHTDACAQGNLLHREAFTQRSFYTASSCRQQAFTHSKLLHREAFTRNGTVHTQVSAPERKKDDFESFLKQILKRK